MSRLLTNWIAISIGFGDAIAFAQAPNVGQEVSKIIDAKMYRAPDEAVVQLRESLRRRDSIEVGNELIAQLNTDLGSLGVNNVRDSSVRDLYRELGLPLRIICEKLDNEDEPFRKIQLMGLLKGRVEAEATDVLIHQLSDRRKSGELGRLRKTVPNPGTDREYRICDAACNFLVWNLREDAGKVSDQVGLDLSHQERDDTIAEWGRKLKLTPEQKEEYFKRIRRSAVKGARTSENSGLSGETDSSQVVKQPGEFPLNGNLKLTVPSATKRKLLGCLLIGLAAAIPALFVVWCVAKRHRGT